MGGHGDSWGATSGGATPKAPLRHLRSYRSRREDAHGDAAGDRDAHGDPGDPGDPGAAFTAALEELARSPPGRGGRLALVEAALAALPARGAGRSLAAYKALLRLLPRGAWVPRGAVQRLLFPFPRQQECGLRLLECMERHGACCRPLRKLQRMQFWLPRLRHLDPHPLPPRLRPGLAAARLGLQRIATEPGATVTLVQRPVPESGDDEGSVQPYILRRRRNVNCLRHAVIWYEDHRQRCPYEPRLAELDPSVGLYTTAVWQCERGHRYFQDLHSPLRPPSDS
ncbi:Zinc finger protein 653, partial [Lonchura striata]